MSFAAQMQVDEILQDVQSKLSQRASGVMQAFHAIDKDNSNQLSTDEFATVLKDFGIVLPRRTLTMLVARFDANGDGSVSIPEFSAFMSGNKGQMESLAQAEAVVDETPSPMAAAMGGSSLAMARSAARRSVPASQTKAFSEVDAYFLARMEVDIEERRKVAFIVRAQTLPTRTPRPEPDANVCRLARSLVADGAAQGPALPAIDARAAKVQVQGGDSHCGPDHQDAQALEDRARAEAPVPVGTARWVLLIETKTHRMATMASQQRDNHVRRARPGDPDFRSANTWRLDRESPAHP